LNFVVSSSNVQEARSRKVLWWCWYGRKIWNGVMC
jgi:hypothetical protein